MTEITFYTILGKPLIFYMGILTYLLFTATALIQVSNKYLKKKIPFKWHQRLAYAALALATIHGLMGISIYV